MRLRRRGMGLITVGSDASGNSFYIAEQGEDTSDLYPVSQDSFGNAIYSDSPSAVPTSGMDSTLQNLLSTATAVYQQKSIMDINAERLRQGLPALTTSQTRALNPSVNLGLTGPTQQMLLYAGLAFLAYMLLARR